MIYKELLSKKLISKELTNTELMFAVQAGAFLSELSKCSKLLRMP